MALLVSFKQTTPLGSIMNGPPTLPLIADAKFSERAAAILRVSKGCKNGYPPSVPWTVYKLNAAEPRPTKRTVIKAKQTPFAMRTTLVTERVTVPYGITQLALV
jgi:hypothetical protein